MNMKKLIPFLCLGFLFGCATAKNDAKFPTPSPGFAPKQNYTMSFDAAWAAVLSAMEKNRIPVVSQDKASGVIQTDYLQGPSRTIGLIVAAQTTRYKYNVTVRKQAEKEVKVSVISKLESSLDGGQGGTQWHDVGSANAAILKSLETWLYEEVEKEF